MSDGYEQVAEAQEFWANVLMAGFNLLLFLMMAELIGFALYLSILAMPMITAALSLGLVASLWMISFVAALPFLIALTVLFQFVLVHLEFYLSVKQDYSQNKPDASFLDILKVMVRSPRRYITCLLTGLVFALHKDVNLEKDADHLMVLAFVVAFSIAISLALPMASVFYKGLILALGLPSGFSLYLVIFFLISFIFALGFYQALMAPFILFHNWLRREENTKEEMAIQIFIVLLALGIAVPICYFCFPLLTSLLSGLILVHSGASSLIVLAAVAISSAFIFLVLNLGFQLQRIITALVIGKYPEYDRGLSALLPSETLAKLAADPVPVLPSLRLMLCGYASVAGTQLREEGADAQQSSFHFCQQTISVDFYNKQLGYFQEFKHEKRDVAVAGNPSDAFYQNTDALVIAYDANNHESFTHATTALETFQQASGSHKIRHFMLLGCITDSQIKAVSTEELQKFAAEKGVFYKEASVQTEQEVQAVFRDFATHIVQNTASYTPISYQSIAK